MSERTSVTDRRPRHAPRVSASIVLWASACHLAWGIVLLLHGPPPLFTAAAGLRTLVPDPHIRAAVLILTALTAIGGRYLLQTHHASARLLSMVPQQFILLLSAASAIHAISVGHYPDGTPRAPSFILLDQLPLILGTVLYTAAILWPAITLAARSVRMSHS